MLMHIRFGYNIWSCSSPYQGSLTTSRNYMPYCRCLVWTLQVNVQHLHVQAIGSQKSCYYVHLYFYHATAYYPGLSIVLSERFSLPRIFRHGETQTVPVRVVYGL